VTNLVTQDYMGDSMEDRKKLDPKYLEILAEEEFHRLKGSLVRVRAINGYANDIASDTFYPDTVGEPTIVRIGEADIREDIHRWMDEWLDPVYPVEIVSYGNLPQTLHSCWICGNSRSLYGGFEPGDIWAIDHSLSKIEDIASRLGGKICDPPPNRKHMIKFLADRDREGIYEYAKEVSNQFVGRSVINQDADSVMCEHANECPLTCCCPSNCTCRETMCRPNTRYHIEPEDPTINSFFAKKLIKLVNRAKGTSETIDEVSCSDTWKLFISAHNLDGSLERDFRHWCRGQGIDLDRVTSVRLDGEYIEWMMGRMMSPLIEKICVLEDRIEALEKRRIFHGRKGELK